MTTLKARDVMTRKVLSVSPETPVRTLAAFLVEHRVSAVPVVGADDVPLGVVSEADFVHRPELATLRRRSWWLAYVADPQGGAEDFIRTHGRTAAQIMHRGVVAVAPDLDLAEVAALLDRKKVKRVYVIDGNAIAGVISRSDFVRAIVGQTAGPRADGARSDSEIREDIENRIAAESWAPRALVTVMVSGGTVSLLGMVTSEAERTALELLATEATGVARVEDHLVVRAMPLLAGHLA